MLERRTRATVLQLKEKGLGTRAIARTLSLSRGAVKRVIAQGSEEPVPVRRPSSMTDRLPEILELKERCRGNLVRVHEELSASGAKVSYPALTAFVRSVAPPTKIPAGRYHFAPGKEIQHDTSPHDAVLGEKKWRLQTASAVLCHSRMLFFQCYVRFTRFEAKVFLTEALRFFGGVTERIMVDNTSVIRGHGTGAAMEPAPEMAAFSERFGFVFVAHEVNDVNRSARVERPFSFIEGNFLCGRTFTDLRQLNREALSWCQKVNASHKRHLHASPRELFVQEQIHLRPLPVYVPEPERIEMRTVDVEGFVCVDTNRYSVSADWIHRQVQVRVTAERVEIDQGRKTIVHERVLLPTGQRAQLAEHRRPYGEKAHLARQLSEERELVALLPGIASYLSALKKSGHKAPQLLLRRLLRMTREYPHEALLPALEDAVRYGLYDLDRLERMVLKRIQTEYFRLREDDDE
jgi:transposase